MKTILMILSTALLLAACASGAPGDGSEQASAREERHTPLGTYLPRKRGQTANNAGTVSPVDLENMKNAGAATVNVP